MGTIVTRPQKDGTTRYRAQIRIKKDGAVIHSESRTFSKRAMAQAWMAKREGELEVPGAIEATKHKAVLVGDLIQEYLDVVMADGSFGRTKQAHLKQLLGYSIARLPATTLTSLDVLTHVGWRRKNGAGPTTAGNDLVWLRVVFRYARRVMGIPAPLDVINVAAEEARAARMIAKARRRTRRPTPEELELLDAHFRRPLRQLSSPPMRLFMWLAIYSCRREDELCNLLRSSFHEESKTYLVRDMKHPDGSAGNDKLALLPERGWGVVRAILRDVPSDDGRLLPFKAITVSAAWTRACKALGIQDLRFHDLRHEGASRLGEDGATIPEMQQVTQHESWGSLQIYVNMPPIRQRRVDFEDIKRLPASPSLRRLLERPDT